MSILKQVRNIKMKATKGYFFEQDKLNKAKPQILHSQASVTLICSTLNVPELFQDTVKSNPFQSLRANLKTDNN